MRKYELVIESEKLLKKGDLIGAIQKLNHALILDPNVKEVKEILMDLYIVSGDTTNILSLVNELLKIEPQNTKYLLAKASCLNDMNELEESLELCNRIILINPELYEAYGCRGMVYLNKSQLDNAMQDFNKAIDNSTKNAIIYASRGIVFIEKKDFKLALKDFDRSLKIDKNLEVARLNKAFVLRMLGKFNEAMKEIEKIEHVEVSSEGNHQKGIIFLKNNRIEEALINYNKAIELDGNNVEALYSRAMLYAKMNNFENAFKDLDLSMQLENSHFKDFLLNGYADVYRKIKDYNKAIKFVHAALDHNSGFFYAYITLAEIYGEIGDNENFYKNLQIGLESGFNLDDIDEFIKKKYFKDKEFKKFIKKFKKKKAQ